MTGHFEQLLSGQHFAVFSEPYAGSSGIRQRWNVKPEQKVLLMTLSSYDEAYAALLIDGCPYKKVVIDVFRTQAGGVKATIDWVAAHGMVPGFMQRSATRFIAGSVVRGLKPTASIMRSLSD